MTNTNATPYWDAGRHADRRPLLLVRGAIKSAIRTWFEQQDFIEVDTGILQTSPGNETHVHAFATGFVSGTAGRDVIEHPLYLHTSPEFACKKLLAAGEERLFTFTPVFRNRDRSRLHHPEFMMLEWYRAGASYQTLFSDCAALLRIAAEAADRSQWSDRGNTCDATAALHGMTVADAFAQFAGIDLLSTIDEDGIGLSGSLARAVHNAQSAGDMDNMRIAHDDTWDDVFSRVLTASIEPALAEMPVPVILKDYPTPQAALARRHSRDPRIAERFELYACGVELANGFGELIDPVEQRARLVEEMDTKERIYGERYPIDEDFIAALGAMPPASGCALGFDRLVMLATGARTVDDVLWTPMPQLP